MKSALLARAALCVCPPAVVATTVAAVPPVRHAVHRFTAAYEPKKAAKPSAPPCVPVNNQTFASQLPVSDVPPIVEEGPPPSGFYSSVPPGTDTFVPTQPSYPPGGPTTTTTNNSPPTPSVPEPEAWVTMVLGFGLIGAGLRQRRRYVVRSRQVAIGGGAAVAAAGGGSVLSGLAAVGAMITPAALNPARASTKLTQLGSKALHSSMLAKAAMCICPPVAMAVGTAAVPPVRHAVYNATAPQPAKTMPAVAVVPQGAPCVPVSVPTAAESISQGQGGDKLAVLEPTANWPS